MDQEIRKGIKTFFINADASLTPEEGQLQALFLSGFEVYPLPESRLLPVLDQIDCLVGLFRELIVFFNVDGALAEGTWPQMMTTLAQLHGDRVRLGVFHHETDPARRAAMEHFYLMEIRVQAGCIYIDQRRTPDMERLHRILVANQANGRRKAIRMPCTGRLNVLVNQKKLEAKVIEISVSHFLCTFRDGDPQLPEGTRLSDVQFMVGGPVLHIDAAVMLKRVSGANSQEMVYVCGFLRKGKTDLGLDSTDTKTLIRLIQNYCTTQIGDLVQATYQKRWKQNVLKRPAAS